MLQRQIFPKPVNPASFWNATLSCLMAAANLCSVTSAAAAGPTWPVAHSKAETQIQPVAVFGTDDRRDLPASRARSLSDKIGVLSIGRSNFCTAFCVAPDTIATASHCLLGTQEQQGPDLSRVTFNVGGENMQLRSSPLLGSTRKEVRRSIRAGTTGLRIRPPIAAERDWAVARLSKPVCTAGGLAMSALSRKDIEAQAAKGNIYQVAMHRDLAADHLVVGAPCAMSRSFPQVRAETIALDFANANAILLHTCDTGLGSSGSPMLRDGAAGPEVVGINVGTYVISPPSTNLSSTAHSDEPTSEAIANTAVPVSQFRKAVDAFAATVAVGQQTPRP
ncbi:MAG: trypsin-like serine protease [Hyphomicrobiaceae bacterium]